MASTTRSKRWNGKFDSLPTEFLKGVQAKMQDYGERVRFSLVSGGGEPSYQIETSLGKTMHFDRNHHLLSADPADFVGANASQVFTLDQVKSGVAGMSVSPTARPGTVRAKKAEAGTPRTTAAKLEEQHAAERYEFFKTHRASLPPTITKYSDEIAGLMKRGVPVADAFDQVFKKYY